MVTREELIKSDEFWEEIIETILLPENHHSAVKYVLDLKNELLSLPLGVPTEEQSKTKGEEMGEHEDSNKKKFIDGNYTEGWDDCYAWMKEEIEKRNT